MQISSFQFDTAHCKSWDKVEEFYQWIFFCMYFLLILRELAHILHLTRKNNFLDKVVPGPSWQQLDSHIYISVLLKVFLSAGDKANTG